MRLPNFLCVGTQKAATTTLFNILKQHPDIFLPPSKEAWFFHKDSNYQKGLDWYLNEDFTTYAGEKAVGDITPEYMYFSKVPQRLYNDLGPALKTIFILRDPVNRAFSQYLMSKRRGHEPELFLKATELERERLQESFWHKIHFSYIDRGRYQGQIQNFIKLFPPENLMFLIFEEDIRQNIKLTIDKILQFLEVAPRSLDYSIKSHQATSPRSNCMQNFITKPNIFKKICGNFLATTALKTKVSCFLYRLNQKNAPPQKLDQATRKLLMNQYFLQEREHLEKLLNRDLNIWYDDCL